jgi:hypothetical protein
LRRRSVPPKVRERLQSGFEFVRVVRQSL